MGRGVPPRPPKPSDPVIGLPVKATPNQELPSIYIGKKTKWRTKLPQGFACASLPLIRSIFAGRGQVVWKSISKKTKLLRGVIGRRVYLRRMII